MIGSKKLAPLFHPIRSKTKTNHDSLTRVFPRFASTARNFLEFGLVHYIVFSIKTPIWANPLMTTPIWNFYHLWTYLWPWLVYIIYKANLENVGSCSSLLCLKTNASWNISIHHNQSIGVSRSLVRGLLNCNNKKTHLRVWLVCSRFLCLHWQMYAKCQLEVKTITMFSSLCLKPSLNFTRLHCSYTQI